ncbi:endonuclease SmrB [Parashewanella spongiae]|uniref:Ribosome rescue factor SmrB n=1 Tax=Parashewanella spongiae TaxID=342950 RepID=A0A3A6UAY8_9GAMM|nr:endonuclease SmrB [Parashewanella spongiae]MCL1076902.1 endonuclease SmrB [Parashewanella spongiae]RJY19151.1 endonuclease SmrB [Parashewanella spongiae]
MNKKTDNNEFDSFADLMKGVKPIPQDKVHFKHSKKSKKVLELNEQKIHVDSYFSDTYHPLLPSEGPMRWKQDGVDSFELKRLRRGDYIPELLLDLHGLRQSEAKLEIAALIQACVKQRVNCCSIMHGYGTGILKQKVPSWLAQHPKVLAFHQASKEWGSDAALLILIDIEELHP